MEEKKKFKLGLLPKLIIAIIVGILFGQFLPEGFCRFVVTLSSFFSQFLSFIIPLMNDRNFSCNTKSEHIRIRYTLICIFLFWIAIYIILT